MPELYMPVLPDLSNSAKIEQGYFQKYNSRKLTQMTKIRNTFNVLVLFNENEHGCNNEQA